MILKVKRVRVLDNLIFFIGSVKNVSAPSVVLTPAAFAGICTYLRVAKQILSGIIKMSYRHGVKDRRH